MLSQGSFLLESQQGSSDTTTDKDWLYLLALHLQVRHSKSRLTQLSAFKISIKLNEKKSSRLKNFRWFRRFALHYESAESAESWENFVLLAVKRLD